MDQTKQTSEAKCCAQNCQQKDKTDQNHAAKHAQHKDQEPE